MSDEPCMFGCERTELVDEINRMEREISALRDTLIECLDWFKERYDASCEDGSWQGNEEMRMGQMINEALERKYK